jgi:hypothetical protein
VVGILGNKTILDPWFGFFVVLIKGLSFRGRDPIYYTGVGFLGWCFKSIGSKE